MADGTGALDRRKLRLAAALGIVALAGCGGDDEPAGESPTTSTTTAATTTSTTTTEPDQPPPKGEPTKPAEAPPGDPRTTELEQAAEQAARDYIDALNARDGAAVCELFAPGVLDAVDLPEPRGDCAASVSASIGYRDPRGLPVWKRAHPTHLRVAKLGEDGGSAEVVATVVTTFADRDELSTEDDVIYLTRDGDRWLLAKPSATFYRAIGVGDIPASVLAPPSG